MGNRRESLTTSAVAYVRRIGAAGVPSAATQRRELQVWARGARTTISHWFVDDAGPCRVEERPALVRALCALGSDVGVLCLARPEVLQDVLWARTVVERLAMHAGAKVVYASGGALAAPGSMELDEALVAHERILLRMQATRAAERPPGDISWRRIPWGYRLSADGKSLEPCAAEQAVTGVVRHMRMRGFKLREIREELKRLRVVGRTGKPLGITRIYELLDEGRGSRLDVLAERLAEDHDTPPASVVRPSVRPGADDAPPIKSTRRRRTGE